MNSLSPEDGSQPSEAKTPRKATVAYHRAMHRLGGYLHHFGARLQRKHGPEEEKTKTPPS